ncbi:MAG: glycosyltransferase [Coriobacteriaceae bacterium]|nr:MAG: glycosyltransferase [Coriobacteriaceae bacterium]
MAADQVKLSIIVPCYKVEKYLPKCLASLMGQTLDNYEVICINDGLMWLANPRHA